MTEYKYDIILHRQWNIFFHKDKVTQIVIFFFKFISFEYKYT